MGKPRFSESDLPYATQARVGNPDQIEAEESAVRGPDSYDASDPAQVGERRIKAKNTENERILGLRYVMSTRQGRAWMRHLLEEKLFTPVMKVQKLFTGNSATFYNTGLREAGDVLQVELKTLVKNEYRLMEDEASNG